jgi:hypothetical protein
VPTFLAVPLTRDQANEFVGAFHRHNKPVTGHRFSIGAVQDEELVAVAIVGRPTARMLQDGTTADVTRLCSFEHARNAPSFLYSACWRAWRAMGGTRLITCTLQRESGASLRGAGWKVVAELKAGRPVAWQSRAGRQAQLVVSEPKIRWEAV